MAETYKAQFNLMPVESKKLIGIAVCELPEVKRAFKEGIIVLKAQATSYFILQRLMEWAGRPGEPRENFVCGLNQPLGACHEIARSAISLDRRLDSKAGKRPTPPIIPQYAFEKGKVVCMQDNADPWVFRMTKNDIYIGGANAIDPTGKLGIQCVGPDVGSAEKPKGATIQRHLPYIEKYDIRHLVPVGLEKMIPTSIDVACKAAPMGPAHARLAGDCIYSDGKPMGLLPLRSPPAEAITEVEAIKILTGATAVPFGAGGILGAEGSIQLMVTGSREQVERAIELRAGQIRGAFIPNVKIPACELCFSPCMWSRQWGEIQEDFAETKFAKKGLETYPWLSGVAQKYRSKPFYDQGKKDQHSHTRIGSSGTY